MSSPSEQILVYVKGSPRRRETVLDFEAGGIFDGPRMTVNEAGLEVLKEMVKRAETLMEKVRMTDE